MAALSNILAVEFKKTEQLSMTKSLSEYISTSYAEHPDTYQDDFRVLDELRADIVSLEPHQNALNRLLKYVVQTRLLSGCTGLLPQLTYTILYICLGTMPSWFSSALSFPLM